MCDTIDGMMNNMINDNLLFGATLEDSAYDWARSYNSVFAVGSEATTGWLEDEPEIVEQKEYVIPKYYKGSLKIRNIDDYEFSVIQNQKLDNLSWAEVAKTNNNIEEIKNEFIDYFKLNKSEELRVFYNENNAVVQNYNKMCEELVNTRKFVNDNLGKVNKLMKCFNSYYKSRNQLSDKAKVPQMSDDEKFNYIISHNQELKEFKLKYDKIAVLTNRLNNTIQDFEKRQDKIVDYLVGKYLSSSLHEQDKEYQLDEEQFKQVFKVIFKEIVKSDVDLLKSKGVPSV